MTDTELLDGITDACTELRDLASELRTFAARHAEPDPAARRPTPHRPYVHVHAAHAAPAADDEPPMRWTTFWWTALYVAIVVGALGMIFWAIRG